MIQDLMELSIFLRLAFLGVCVQSQFEDQRQLALPIGHHQHPIVTRVSKVTRTLTSTVIPTCYEPSGELNICRKKREFGFVEIPSDSTGSRRFMRLGPGHQYISPELAARFRPQPQFPEQRHAAVELESSFATGGLPYPQIPDQYTDIVNGYFYTKYVTETQVVTTQADVTQTLKLDCIWPGAALPADLCQVAMVFPPAPNGVYLEDYCNVLANLGKAAVSSCSLTSDGTDNVVIRFKKAEFGPYPNRRDILRYIIKSVSIFECNPITRACHLPGLPVGTYFDFPKIIVPGISNIFDLITQLFREIFGTDCASGFPFHG